MDTYPAPLAPTFREPTHAAPGVKYDRKSERLVFAEPRDDARTASARMSLHGEAATPESDVALDDVRASMPPEAAARMLAYRPQLPKEQEEIRDFVERCVALALPQTMYTVEVLLRPCLAFALWAVFVVGAPMDARVVFDRDLIERYIRSGLENEYGVPLADGTLRNYRAWILRVAEVVNPDGNPRQTLPLNSRGMDAPYDYDEQEALKRWATGQGTVYMRRGAQTLISLGAGAGLSSGEIVLLRREDVAVADNSAVVLTVTDTDGERSREVVVAGKHEKRLVKLLRDVPAGAFVFLPKRTRTENDVVSAFVARSSTPSGTPAIKARRLRNTWLVERMTDRVDVFTLMQAAGLQSLESISRLAVFVPQPDESTRIAQLRGRK